MIVLVLLSSVGCRSWHPTTVSPGELVRTSPRSIRITNADRIPVTVSSPLIRNDSILSPNSNPPGFPSNSVGAPLTASTTIEVSRFSPLKTAAFVGAAFIVSASWVRAVGSGGGSGEPPDPIGKFTGRELWNGLQTVVGWIR